MKKRLFDISIILILVVAAFVVYSNTFDASFHYDDFDNIVNNERIHMEEFGWKRLASSYDPSYPLDRPVAYMSFALNYYFGELNVFGYHLVNILIHILTGIGVYFLIKITLTLPSIPSRQGRGGISRIPSPLAGEGQGEGALRNPSFIAALAALLWLLSPVQTQAVTYIVQRMASMAALFYVWSFLCYIKGRTSGGGKRWGYLALFLILFLYAVATKQNTITIPLMVVLYEVAFFRKGLLNIFREKWFYISVLACVSVAGGYLYIFREFFDLSAYFRMGYGVRERLFTEARVITGHYIPAMFFPVPSRLALIHDFPLSRGLLAPFTTLPSLLFVVGATALSFYSLRSAPGTSFFVLWFFINLVPESVLMGLDFIYEHRLYLPSIGFYAAIAWAVAKIWETGRWRKLSAGLIALILVFLSINTFDRNKDWYDEVSLWSDNVKKAPELSKSREGMGMAYLKEGELEKAEDELKIAKELDPMSLIAASGLGTISYMRGDIEGAFREFEYFADRRRVGSDAFVTGIDRVFYSIGTDLLGKDRPLEAAKMFRLGLNVNPKNRMIENALNKLKEVPAR